MAIPINARIETSAINAYTAKRIEPIYRKSVLMGMLKSRGRMNMGLSGKTACDWFPRFRRRDIVAGDGNPVSISFPSTNTRRPCSLDWINYNLGESLTKMERLTTGGDPKNVLFKIVDDVIDQLGGDFEESFRLKLFEDGNATGSKEISGLETIFSVNGVVSGSMAGDPNDNYAGQSTALGVTGDWTPDSGDGWPTGTGDTEYNWWSPLVVDYQNSGWEATTKTWVNTWQEAVGYAITYLSLLQTSPPDVLLLNGELLRLAKRSLQGIQRFEITQSSELTKLGHKTLQYEGLEIVTEYGIPSGVGYFLNFDKLELRSLQDVLFGKADDNDITTSTELLALDFYGQLVIWAPSYFGKLAPVTALGT
ncbi:hypothetical protein LCGC14_1813450 [marine sediment metagenome]|uniref:Major capsid protein n=1 Tax=marine sediment metagenome TaxID=412755 RepID=A0A0F9J0T3_9ZZZZ